MLGIYEDGRIRQSLYEDEEGEKLYPPEPLVEAEQWTAIKDYFIQNAPESLPEVIPRVELGLSHFIVQEPSFTVTPPNTTMVKFMEDGSIYSSDAISKKLLQFDSNLNLMKAGNIPEGAVDLRLDDEALWILSMGSFSPNDQEAGMLLCLPKEEGRQALIVADNLRRPAHADYGDINKDGLEDVIISEFGKWSGRLTLLLNKGRSDFESITIKNQTGATKAYFHDFNADGHLDIVALFAQGREQISIFYGSEELAFKEEIILTFSPSSGSTNLDLIDYDEDGDMDILYTAGDNADYIPILKSYHGIYLFENRGQNHFTEKFFQPLNGANGARLVDFDLDGDLDLAAISFFPDYRKDAVESFVYFENAGDFEFSGSTFENNTRGRWIVMDVKDKDGDGDQDIILGSLTFETIPDKGYVSNWKSKGLPFVVLQNTIRD